MKVRCLQCGIKEPHQKFMFRLRLEIGQRRRKGWICSGHCFRRYAKRQFNRELERSIARHEAGEDARKRRVKKTHPGFLMTLESAMVNR